MTVFFGRFAMRATTVAAVLALGAGAALAGEAVSADQILNA